MTYDLYHGDCLEVMRTLPSNSVDLGLIDPPYPGLKGNLSYGRDGVGERFNPTASVGDLWDATLEWIPLACRIVKRGIVCFCSHHSVSAFYDAFVESGLDCRGLGVWYKRNAPNPVRNVPKMNAEYFWLFQKKPGLKWSNIELLMNFPMLQAGCFATERILKPGTKAALHPAQKPVKLISEILKIGGESVLDCFMGTGTTGEACANNGRSFVGIERDNIYFPIAQERVEAAYRRVGDQARLGKPADYADMPMFAEVIK